MMMDDNVCFVDTETLGLDADVHPIWEIALIRPNGAEQVWQVTVSDRDITLAHPKALEIGRFDERYQKERDSDWPQDVVRDLMDAIPTGSHLAGAVVSFDEERLRRMFWKAGRVPHWHYHLIDVEVLAAGWLAAAFDPMEPRSPEGGPDKLTLPWDSEELSRAVGVEPDRYSRHTALGDARWAKAVYEAVMFPGQGARRS